MVSDFGRRSCAGIARIQVSYMSLRQNGGGEGLKPGAAANSFKEVLKRKDRRTCEKCCLKRCFVYMLVFKEESTARLPPVEDNSGGKKESVMEEVGGTAGVCVREKGDSSAPGRGGGQEEGRRVRGKVPVMGGWGGVAGGGRRGAGQGPCDGRTGGVAGGEGGVRGKVHVMGSPWDLLLFASGLLSKIRSKIIN